MSAHTRSSLAVGCVRMYCAWKVHVVSALQIVRPENGCTLDKDAQSTHDVLEKPSVSAVPAGHWYITHGPVELAGAKNPPGEQVTHGVVGFASASTVPLTQTGQGPDARVDVAWPVWSEKGQLVSRKIKANEQ